MEKRAELVCDLSLQLLVLSRIARKLGIPVVITNHVYEDFSLDRQLPVGGHTLKYWSKVIISLTRTGTARRKAVLVRHPFLPEGRSCYFTFSDEGMGADE
jgi:DNA repair protein RadB